MKSKKGFSIVEVLTTAIILAIGITGLMYTYVVCHRIVIDNTNRYNATMIINEQFEEIIRKSTALNVDAYLASAPKDFTMQAETQASSSVNYTQPTRNYTLTLVKGADVNPIVGAVLSTVIATVSWRDGGEDRSLTMSMFTNYPY